MENSSFLAFKKASQSKSIKAVLLIHSPSEGTFIRLCLEERNKYTQKYEMIFIEYPVHDIKYEGCSPDKPQQIENLQRISFHEHALGHGLQCTLTMLKSIKESSKLKLNVVAFNTSKNLVNANFTAHTAYLYVDEKCFLFQSYVGPDNLSSPIQY